MTSCAMQLSLLSNKNILPKMLEVIAKLLNNLKTEVKYAD